VRIAILATGGTFDKEYKELDGTLYFRGTHVKEMLALGRARLPVRLHVLMMKDSLQMDDDDRRLILTECLSCSEGRIVVTHGTDTMEYTARFLEGRIPGKTVILTGAMKPYTFGSSDGMFNLGSALSFVQVVPEGVYIAMNGRLFRPREVRKDRQRGVFVAIRGGGGA
jgi:L-asparaginase